MRYLIFLLVLTTTVVQAQTALLPVDSAGYYRLIDLNGTEKTAWKKLDGMKFSTDNNLLLAKDGNRWGVVNDSLTFIIPPKYDSIYTCNGDIYAQRFLSLDIYRNDTLYKQVKDVERAESFIFTKWEATEIAWNISRKTRYVFHLLDGAYITDSTLTFTEKYKYDDAFIMNNLIYTRRGTGFGFYTPDAEIEPTYKNISVFSNSIMELWDQNQVRHYFLTDGREIPYSDSVLQVHDGFYKIYRDGKGELYDQNLKPLIQYTGEDIFCISPLNTDYIGSPEDYFRFAFKSQGKIGVCDGHGKVLINPEFKQIYYSGSNRYIVTRDSLYGVIDQNAQWVIKPVYTFIDNACGYFRVYDYSKKGLLDHNGNMIVPALYDEVACPGNCDGVLTLKDEKMGYYTLRGKRVLTNEWHFVFDVAQNCYEFISADGSRHCIVDSSGLQTPVNCTHAYVGETSIKYYTADHIVICHYENGIKSDSTVYPRGNSVVVTGRTEFNFPKNIHDYDCTEYRNQLNGKIGSKNREGIEDAVFPEFDNVLDLNFKLVKRTLPGSFYFAGIPFTTKEMVSSFSGEGCSMQGSYYAYLASGNFGFWHTNALDPTFSSDNQFEYASPNHFATITPVAMLARKGFAAISLSAGEINRTGGQTFSDFRSYFESLNSGLNLVISDISTFSLLSQSPTLYVSDPVWHVLSITDRATYHLAGDFVYYEQNESGSAVYSTDGYQYGIYFEGDKKITAEIFAKIIPFTDGVVQYFYVCKMEEDLEGNTIYKWTVYNNSEQYLPAYYDRVELIGLGYYKVWLNGLRYVTNRSGKVIYKLP